jgi:hypothetical protein
MPIRTVVTRGYGNGTFSGSIGKVVTRGYTISDVITPQIPGAIKVPSRKTAWGAVVKQAEGKDANRKDPQYQFSNKRTFY